MIEVRAACVHHVSRRRLVESSAREAKGGEGLLSVGQYCALPVPCYQWIGKSDAAYYLSNIPC